MGKSSSNPAFADKAGVTLTTRERQVAELIAQSKTDKEIAQILALSTNTVRGYVKTVYRKLEINKRTGVYPALQVMPAKELPPDAA